MKINKKLRRIKNLWLLLTKFKSGRFNVLRDYAGWNIKQRPYRIMLRNGLCFFVPSWEAVGPISSIIVRGEYGELKHLNEGTVLDMGAHIGTFSVLVAHLHPKMRVLAFEPVKENYELLKRNVLLNNCKNVDCINSAIAGSTGFAMMALSSTGDSQNHKLDSLNLAADNLQNLEKVRVESLDSVLKNLNGNCSMLKLDIEGAEYEALLSVSDAALQIIEKILIEVHPNPKLNTGNLLAFLKVNGNMDAREIMIAGYPHVIATR